MLSDLSQSAWADITKHHRLGGLSNRQFSSTAGGQKSEMRGPSQLGSSSWFVHGDLLSALRCRGDRETEGISSGVTSYKGTNPTMTLYLHAFIESSLCPSVPVSKYPHIGG